MKLKFKSRIAFFLTLAAAASTLLVFVAVYAVVYLTAYRHLDDDILKEKQEVFKALQWEQDSIILLPSIEWKEREHEQVEVNPTFLQITDKNAAFVFLSPNLKNEHLKFDRSLKKAAFFNDQFDGKRIRQGQFPVFNQAGRVVGQLSIGISQVESALVLQNLRLILVLAFPLLTLVFYGASSLAAAQGIAPIHQLMLAAKNIDDKNISTRLPMPPRRDEIYQLATTINELLQRVESSLYREKQITADISHELRSPLTGIRGMLEVLLRKKREPEQYEQKIVQVLRETDRMNLLLEQLLQLARMDAGQLQPNLGFIDVIHFFQTFLEKWTAALQEKQMQVALQVPAGTVIHADHDLLEIIISNLGSNALKYGAGNIDIRWDEPTRTLVFQDDGPGIPASQLPFIFDRFYRADGSRNSKVSGTGLGLAIVKKIADLQGIQLAVTSEERQGTTFFLHFPA